MVEECDVERVHCEHLDILQRKTVGVRLLILISLAIQILVKLMIPPNNVQYLRRAKCLKVLQSEERNERADVLGKPGCGVQFRVGLAVTPRHDRYNHRLQTFTWRIFC